MLCYLVIKKIFSGEIVLNTKNDKRIILLKNKFVL